jgi:hypothetical protein
MACGHHTLLIEQKDHANRKDQEAAHQSFVRSKVRHLDVLLSAPD